MTIIEWTTGNAGIACAAVAAVRGYDCVIIMPEGMSLERKRMIAAYGAELVLTPGAGTDIGLALARMREIASSEPDRYFFAGEFENPDNPGSQTVSGEEIWEQTGGGVDAVDAAKGTGGWMSGVARALKAHDPAVRAYTVEPAECPLISAERWGTHGIPGIGDGIIPREEGILCGPSSGINVVAALKVAAARPGIRRIVTVVADTGQRYLSVELSGERPDVVEPDREHPIDPASLVRLAAHRDRIEFIA